MVKTNLDNESIKPYMLVDKDEFRRQLDERIAIGKQLLEIKVEGRTVNKGYNLDGLGRPYQKVAKIYDEAQLQDFADKFNKWNDFNYELIKFAFKTPANQYLITYRSKGKQSVFIGDEDMLEVFHEEIIQKIGYLESLKDIITLVPYDSSYKAVEKAKTKVKKDLSTKVFIVHGHNEAVNQDVARTIEKLGLEAIILREQPNSGQTIMEKFENNANKVNFAVILLTADDQMPEADTFRARQNVIFEMGYFMGALGRCHVMCLLQDKVEKPGDIDGVVYTSIDKSGIWKYSLVKELKACGYDVDANKIM